eukprot:gene10229-8147_t
MASQILPLAVAMTAVKAYALNDTDDQYWFKNVPCWKPSKCFMPGTGTFHFDRLVPEHPISPHVNVRPCRCLGDSRGGDNSRGPQTAWQAEGKQTQGAQTACEGPGATSRPPTPDEVGGAGARFLKGKIVIDVGDSLFRCIMSALVETPWCLKGKRVIDVGDSLLPHAIMVSSKQRIIFAGDSLFRHMMLALVSTLRGLKRPLFPDSHEGVMYLMHEDRDEFFMEELKQSDFEWDSNHSKRSYHKPDTVEIMFLMFPFVTQLMTPTDLERFRPDVLVSGHFYWEQTLQSEQRAAAPSILNNTYAPKKWIHLLQPDNPGVVRERNLLNEEFYKQLMKEYPQKMYLIGM